MKLLFTCVGRRVELLQAYRNAANVLNTNLIIHGTDMSTTAPALRFCDVQHLVPRIDCDDYIPKLLEICNVAKIDALIPTIDTDLLLLSKNKSLFENRGTKVVIGTYDKIGICRDKRLTATFFESCGLAAPRTFDNLGEYNGGFPAFIKPKDGSSSINAFKVNDLKQMEIYSRIVDDYIIQPFIDGEEYTVDIFCDFDGNPIFITPRIRKSVRAGEVLKTEIRNDDSIISDMMLLIDKFKPCGAITVQLIKQKNNGKNIYIEINPRYGGGAPLSIKAGADSAQSLLKLLMGEKELYHPTAAENGAEFSRYDQSIRVN